MQDYLSKLFLSPLPVPLWVVAALWVAVHCSSLVLASRSTRMASAEQHIVFPPAAQPRLTSRMIALQTACSIAVFLYSLFAGGALASAFAGGWLIAAIYGLSLNVRGVLLIRARSSPGSVRGRVEISVDAALKERAAELWAGVLWCMLAAVVVPQPAFLGGAWILGSGAAGLMRRARLAGETVTA